MKTDYDSNLPIETLFEQIDSASKYTSAGGAPYTPEQIDTMYFF